MRQVIEHTPSSNSRKFLVIPHYFGAGEKRTSKEGRKDFCFTLHHRQGTASGGGYREKTGNDTRKLTYEEIEAVEVGHDF